MTINMLGYQLNFRGRKTHKKARWKRARKRLIKWIGEENL